MLLDLCTGVFWAFYLFIYLYVLGLTEWINMSALDKQGSSVWRYKKKGLDVLLMFVFYKAIISELLLFFNKSFFF